MLACRRGSFTRVLLVLLSRARVARLCARKRRKRPFVARQAQRARRRSRRVRVPVCARRSKKKPRATHTSRNTAHQLSADKHNSKMCSVNVVFLSTSFYLSILSACSGRLPAAGALFAGGEAGGGAVAAGRAGGAVAGGVVARRRVVAGGRQGSAWVHNHHHNNELTQLKTGARDVVVGE